MIQDDIIIYVDGKSPVSLAQLEAEHKRTLEKNKVRLNTRPKNIALSLHFSIHDPEPFLSEEYRKEFNLWLRKDVFPVHVDVQEVYLKSLYNTGVRALHFGEMFGFQNLSKIP